MQLWVKSHCCAQHQRRELARQTWPRLGEAPGCLESTHAGAYMISKQIYVRSAALPVRAAAHATHPTRSHRQQCRRQPTTHPSCSHRQQCRRQPAPLAPAAVHRSRSRQAAPCGIPPCSQCRQPIRRQPRPLTPAPAVRYKAVLVAAVVVLHVPTRLEIGLGAFL